MKNQKTPTSLLASFAQYQGLEGPIAGMDEAGCGPWAGPLVVAAAILPAFANELKPYFSEINDSKLLTHKKREALFEAIMKDETVSVGVGIVEVNELDELLLRGALPLAFKRALHNLPIIPASILVDGIRDPKLGRPCHLIKGGDRICLSIATASVVAKVIRDRIMEERHLEYPQYGWDTNKGYGTAQHQIALSLYGVTEHHRKSYAPIQKYLTAHHQEANISLPSNSH